MCISALSGPVNVTPECDHAANAALIQIKRIVIISFWRDPDTWLITRLDHEIVFQWIDNGRCRYHMRVRYGTIGDHNTLVPATAADRGGESGTDVSNNVCFITHGVVADETIQPVTVNRRGGGRPSERIE